MPNRKVTTSALDPTRPKSLSAEPLDALSARTANDAAGDGSNGSGADVLDILARDIERRTSIAEDLSRGELSDEDRQIGIEILEVMARDVERQVREALSEHVRMSPFLPPSIAASLAEDVGSKALPAIQHSKVLSDEVLIAIACGGGEDKQIAVAQRDPLAPQVAEALVDTGNERVVGTLLSNHGADIAERSLLKVLKEFGESGDIQALIVERLALPLALSEELISRISEALCEQLVSRHQLPREMADELAMHGRERALTQAMAAESRNSEIERLAVTLRAKNALSPTLILRALCAGNLDFFQAAMAARAGMVMGDVGPLVFDRGRDGLKEIYRKADLPNELFVAFRSAVDVVNEASSDDRKYRHLEVTERIIGRLRLEYDSVCPEGLEHTLSQLSHFVIGRSESAARGFA
jgi:uncharacterized protein (DUF2336 family)